MTDSSPLYLGFDLSTQQLKAVAVTSKLKVVYSAKFDFDADTRGFHIHKGVLTNDIDHEVYAPVSLWLQALDVLLGRLKDKGLDLHRVRGISGAGQQHGSVYWSAAGEKALQTLEINSTLEEQLGHSFSHPFSPNWQDASTQKECEAFDAALGGPQQLADETGSKAHHRFTGPQILRFQRKHPRAYKETSRISLVSSFLASLFLGKIAPIDISDACGMNLWDIKAGNWSESLMTLASGTCSNPTVLKQQLGPVHQDPTRSLGFISHYMIFRHGFHPFCTIAPFTGDNPATILSLPLRPNDAIVSLGTSTTFLMSTPSYAPSPSTHFFNHPTSPGLYMFMLCYKNGGLAREQVRDAINTSFHPPSTTHSWTHFDRLAASAPILGQHTAQEPLKIGLYFPRPEIVPAVPAGVWRFNYHPTTSRLSETAHPSPDPASDARTILESQLLSLRLRSSALVTAPSPELPPQPTRVYLVGGGSQNATIAKVAGQVLGGKDGVWRLDVGENACALGAAYKAVWTVERKGETFEELVGSRWQEGECAQKIAEGYEKGVWEAYGKGVVGLEAVEREVMNREASGGGII